MASNSGARRSVLAGGLVLAVLAAWLVLARPRAERERAGAAPAAESSVPVEDSGAAPVEISRASVAPEARNTLEEGSDRAAVVVTVVDAADRPLGGIELELLARAVSGEEVVLARSWSRGEDGHTRLVLETSPARGAWLRVVCRASFFPAPALELGAELPVDPVLLRLPAHGSVEVTLQRDGAPVRHPAQVELRLPEHPELPPRIVAAPDGRARFEAVGTGLELELQAFCEESGPSEPLRAGGPRTPGELVTVPLSLGPIWPRVRLRIVAADGTPLAHETFAGWVDYGTHATPLTARPRSDGQGWLEFHLPGTPTEHGERALVLHSVDGDDGARARVAIRDPLDPLGVNTLDSATLPRASGAPSADEPGR